MVQQPNHEVMAPLSAGNLLLKSLNQNNELSRSIALAHPPVLRSLKTGQN